MESVFKFSSFRLIGVLALSAMLASCGQDDTSDADDGSVFEENAAPATAEVTADDEVSDDPLPEIELLPDGRLRKIDTSEADRGLEPDAAPEELEPEPIDTEALLAAIRARDADLAAISVMPEVPPTITTLRALDKITARITELEAVEDQEIRFGTLAISARTCRSRPPEEPPETFAFLEIDDVNTSDERERIFTGWMLASSPALNPLEHAVYDVWVVACRTAETSSPEGE